MFIADAECSFGIPDPDFFPYRILDPTKKKGGHKFHKIENLIF
jgi:hypothetical protein